jgi:hypothetical protein
MRRVMLAAPWALIAYVAPLPVSHGAETVSECVEVAAENAAQGMSLKVHNTCAFAVRCELTWTLRCDGDAEGAGRPMSAAIRLDRGAESSLLASGATCGEKIWEIADDVWSCKEVR